jgi:hypothetical protein
MADVVFIVVLVAFFALASAYVSLCERIVGEPDPPAASTTTHDAKRETAR